MKDIETELLTLLDNADALPFLFVGSGFSKRYLHTPTWVELLRQLAERIHKNYSYYEARVGSGNLPMVASLIAEDYTEAWFNTDLFSDSRDKYSYLQFEPGSALKLGVVHELEGANNFSTRFESLSPELRQEIDLISAIQVAGIITTNYDNLLEELFPSLQKFVGQEELMFGRANFYGELYKIHGSLEDPNSLVFTQEDYKNFEERNSYLAAKLLTFFAERPVIFMGYSFTDEYLAKILENLARAAGPENLDRLEKRFIFVEWDSNPEMVPTIGPASLRFSESSVVATKIRTNSFASIYRVLGKLEPTIPVSVIKQLQNKLYEWAGSEAKSQELPKFTLASMGDSGNQNDKSVFALGYGLISEENLVSVRRITGDDLPLIGARGLTRDDLFKDVLSIERFTVSPESILKNTMPSLPRSAFVPVAKYVAEAGLFGHEGKADLSCYPDSVRVFLGRNPKPNDSEIKAFFKNYEGILRHPSDIVTHEDLKMYRKLQFLLLLNPRDFELKDLEQTLHQVMDDAIDEEYTSYLGKAICHYERLRWLPTYHDNHIHMLDKWKSEVV